MTSNRIKLIACISMLIDHIGVVLFPEVEFLRWIGRLAMPLFAFFIAEGCRYTSNKTRYFLRMLLLGAACQTVYTLEQILGGGLHSVYLNILFTFSFSALLCFAYLHLEKAIETKDRQRILGASMLFVGGLAAVLLIEIFCTFSHRIIGMPVTLDYGAAGVILPLFAIAFRNGKERILLYAVGLILFALSLMGTMPYIWVALLDIPILYFYNGKRGTRRVKYGFYLFYPLHLAVLYGIDLLI